MSVQASRAIAMKVGRPTVICVFVMATMLHDDLAINCPYIGLARASFVFTAIACSGLAIVRSQVKKH